MKNKLIMDVLLLVRKYLNQSDLNLMKKKFKPIVKAIKSSRKKIVDEPFNLEDFYIMKNVTLIKCGCGHMGIPSIYPKDGKIQCTDCANKERGFY